MFTNITYKTYASCSYLIIKIHFEQQYLAFLQIAIYGVMSNTHGCVKHEDHVWQYIKQQHSK